MVATLSNSNSVPSVALSGLDSAIELRNVTVTYRSYKERPTSMKEAFVRLMRNGSLGNYSRFDALSDLTLTIPRGQVLGIIGSNGSGKSTLLKVMAKVLKPTQGSVKISGEVASLIELGVGFDPELNAVENIYLHGALHRKSRAFMKERLDHIIEFAELKDFASTPLKYYSSGMAARLGFAAAVDIDPDILLVDEILSVGDERFQDRCNEVFKRFFDSGKTIVTVSHDLSMIEKLADHVALLSRGELIYIGDPATAIHLYRDPHYQRALG